MGAQRPRKGSPQRPQNEFVLRFGRKMETLTKPQYLLCFSHMCQPRNRRISYKFGVSKRGQSREPPKLLTHWLQNLAIRVPGEPRAGKGSQPSPQRTPKGSPKAFQSDLFRSHGAQVTPKSPQGHCRDPPEAKNGPKICQNQRNSW